MGMFAARSRSGSLTAMEASAAALAQRKRAAATLAFRPIEDVVARCAWAGAALAQMQRAAAHALFVACAGSLECRAAVCGYVAALQSVLERRDEDAPTFLHSSELSSTGRADAALAL